MSAAEPPSSQAIKPALSPAAEPPSSPAAEPPLSQAAEPPASPQVAEPLIPAVRTTEESWAEVASMEAGILPRLCGPVFSPESRPVPLSDTPPLTLDESVGVGGHRLAGQGRQDVWLGIFWFVFPSSQEATV